MVWLFLICENLNYLVSWNEPFKFCTMTMIITCGKTFQKLWSSTWVPVNNGCRTNPVRTMFFSANHHGHAGPDLYDEWKVWPTWSCKAVYQMSRSLWGQHQGSRTIHRTTTTTVSSDNVVYMLIMMNPW